MHMPVMDRIDPNWHYHAINCRFITSGMNLARARKFIASHFNGSVPHYEGRKEMKDTPVRINEKYLSPIRKMAEKEGRTVKAQLERLLETGLSVIADRDLKLKTGGR